MDADMEVGESRRRFWRAQEKRQIVEQTLSSSLSVASVARQHGATKLTNCNRLHRVRPHCDYRLVGCAAQRPQRDG